MKAVNFIVLIFLISGCVQFQKKHATEMQYEQSVGESLSAHQYGNIFFSGQPSDKDFNNLKEQGFVHIINLRGEKEKNYDENQEAEVLQKIDLSYSHIPMDLSMPLTDSYINDVTEMIMKFRKKGKVLVHCSSGQRVALWAGGHFFKDHGFSRQKVEQMTQAMGMEKVLLKDKLSAYTAR